MRDDPSKPGPDPAEPDPVHADPWEAVGRVLAGECADDERRQVRGWLDAHPAEARFVDAVARATPPESAPAGLDVEAALRQVRARLDAPDIAADPASVVRPLRPRRTTAPARRRWPAALAALAAAAVLLLAVLARPDGSAGRAARTLATTVGQRDSLRLPDGSRVVLGPASRLVVAAGYGDEERTVELSGEAFFDVAHDERRPFVVRAGGASVRDLGTAFVVRSAGDEVRVAVTEGAVLLGAADARSAPVRLDAGDRGALRPSGAPEVARGVVTADDVAWTQGRLVFRDAPLAEVAVALRRWYGVELTVADEALAGRTLTAEFTGEPVERVLEVVGLALGARVERRGDTATVHATGPGAR